MKTDFKKALKHLYKPSAKEASFVDVPTMQYLMIDGQGNPGTSERFKAAVETLYPVAYTLKFMIKEVNPDNDFVVPPMEALWWADDMEVFVDGKKDEWKWTIMIMQPDFISNNDFNEAVKSVKLKKCPPLIDELRLEKYTEGKCGQIMHLGPFENEGPTVQKLHKAIEKNGGKLNSKHHEIYLSDIRRAKPENWKTVIRQPYI